MKQIPCGYSHLTGTDARRVRPQFIGNSLLKIRLIKDARAVRPYLPIRHSTCPKNQFNPCNLLIIFCQRDSTDETVSLASFPLDWYGRTARASSIHRKFPAESSFNQGRRGRTLLSQRFLQTISYLLKYQQLIKKKVYGGF